ncbi:MAG: hypothetical protein E2O78_07640 [Caldithrix sp.]|nr:MAG: hypothetical protein E2O78_07640 [Caldithrix sp.]
MTSIKASAFFILVCLFTFSTASAQLSIRTLSTARYGKLPNIDNENNPAVFSDLILEYRYNSFLGGIRTEGFRADHIGNRYDRVSQKYLEYTADWGSARLGNSYAILGRGIIFRGFELPGFVNESRVFRTQHRVIRDLSGLNLNFNRGPVSAKFLLGETPVNALDPPEERAEGDLRGGQLSVNIPANITLGTAYLVYNTTSKDKLSSYFLSWSADDFLTQIGAKDLTFDFYSEYATNKDYGKLAKFNRQTPHALYVTGNFTWSTLGGSLEYKDYQAFDFGINDPPPLIRENSEYLLNRITHRLDSFGERGYQAELYYSPQLPTRITGNFSRAKNNSGNLFLQRYIGIDYTFDPWTARFFFDHGKEEFLSESRRITTGIVPDYTFSNGTIIGLDLEWQNVKREFSPDFVYTLTNLYANLSLQNWHKWSLAFSLERSTDPDVTGVDPLRESEVKYFFNSNVGWQPLPQVSLQLFAGERRRSTQCDHGFCLEVLDYKGVELRLDTVW